MAFFKKQSGGGNKPAMSVQLSVKQGKTYIKGPSFGFWPNENGGPAFRGTLKDDKLAEVLEFVGNAHEAGLPVVCAMFDNSEGGGSFRKPGGFKQGGQKAVFKKPNPFKKQQEEQEEQEDTGEEPF